MLSLASVSRWARALFMPLAMIWVGFLIGFDILSAALAPDAAVKPVQTQRCKAMMDGVQICDIAPPHKMKLR